MTQMRREKAAAIWERDHIRKVLEVETENDLKDLEELVEGERKGKKRRRSLETTRFVCTLFVVFSRCNVMMQFFTLSLHL
jgi:hypothetical protein